MKEWPNFHKITKARGVWLVDSQGKKMIDGVASMWCNVWGHSKPELINSIRNQAGKLQHSPLFNLTHDPAEKLANSVVKLSPGMNKLFFSDNGSTAMEISFKIALQYWKNQGIAKKTKIASLEHGYHGDTFGAMSVGYVPEFFEKFKKQLFSTLQFSVPQKYRTPENYTFSEYQKNCLEKIENKLSQDESIAAFVMESGAQVAGGVIIYPKGFQKKVSKICKKNNVLLILDEIATGFGRLGSMIQYTEQESKPDIVSYGKMLTGGYLTLGVTLTSKKVFDSFLGEFKDTKHLFHGHTYTGNPLAAAIANENIKLYKKNNLIKQIRQTSKIFERFYNEIWDLDLVGDVRHKGMIMGIELVKSKESKIPISPRQSINKIIFEKGRKNGVFLRTLGNIVMIVPPLAISEKELGLLITRTIQTIKDSKNLLV